MKKKNRIRKLPLLLSGQAGATLVSAVSLWVAVNVTSWTNSVVYEMLAVIVFIRALYALRDDSRPFLISNLIRKSVGRIVGDEIQVGIAFFAATYILQWQVSLATPILFFATNLVLQVVAVFLLQIILKTLSAKGKSSPNPHAEKQVVIVGTGLRARRVADSILDSLEGETSVKGFLDYHETGLWRYRDIPLIGHPNKLEQIAATEQIDAVVVAVETSDLPHTHNLFGTAEKMGVPVCLMSDIYRTRLATTIPAWLDGSPALYYKTVSEKRWSQLAKGIVDRVGATVGLVLAAPLVLLAALAIKIDSPGPVLFKQKRCGLNGKKFPLYKFRTMRRDADKVQHQLKDLNIMSGPVFKVKNDPRVTKVGRMLRKWSIDEVPQFINVLRGEMSLVGPRPPLPNEVSQYEPWQRRRLSVKPGVTCLWQVNGRNNINFDKWMQLDLEYIDNWSLWLDAKILARTVPAVIKKTGAL